LREYDSADVIRLECAPVALLELDNPPQNLVTLELTRRLDAAHDRLLGEPDVACVVVAGADERAFCAGSDVSRSSRSSPAASPRQAAIREARLSHAPRR
jgi:enoyl-CoA hydratase/carnithine racemase